ncbi:methionyl-tRNA formyltransferase [Naasia lichenicola]|uniref:Methionyl-tRNA formyltransferase n=1 Tax=Naasia lichenicola TaxID=2565933 RepID=A0A4S4FRY8_9MICO|nr:methionyl-tRNA formyltransferase [Naasia lichenicola]THG33061.1 methionyl-tRNA formyltransferase [Naasia lichenicola]
MRLIFAGTPSAAVPSLDLLARGTHEVAAVLTRPDAEVGRKRVLTPSDVARRALELELPVLRPHRLDRDAVSELTALEADLGVIVAYGALLRAPALAAPRLGWINLHFSLLPRWRGAAPVQRAVMAGDERTGASVFQLEEGLDTGPVYASVECPIGRNESAGHLLGVLADTGAELLASVVDRIAAGRAVGVPQTGEPTLAPKLSLADAAIDWRRPAAEVLARILGTTPEPGAFLLLDGGARLKVLEAILARDVTLPSGTITASDGRILLGVGDAPGRDRVAIELLQVHPAGKRPMPAADWWRGRSESELTVELWEP